MSDPDRCEWCEQDYCLPPKIYTDAGFHCSHTLPMQPGDICEKCGATDKDLMTEEEWEARECCTNSDCHEDPSNEEDCRDDCPHMIYVKVPKGVPE
jgi:hypothetical protein